MCSTDYLALNNHKLFENLREILPKDIIKTQNILTVNDGLLFVWNFQDACVLTLNLKRSLCCKDAGISHQILLPNSSSHFPVDCLTVNNSNTLLVVSGASGVLVLELPERCPPYGSFANNREIIYCRSHNLDEQLFVRHPSVEVRQIRFHPGSPKDTHVLILTSDNALRLYGIENSTAVALTVYNVGERPKGVMPGSKSFFLELYGETAVDFDFGPPEELVSKSIVRCPFTNKTVATSKLLDDFSSNNKLVWPIYLVNGIGSIFYILIDLNDKNVGHVKGPLLIVPSCDQSYTNDACSLICIPSTPPLLCIAENNGTISHAVILPSKYEETDELDVGRGPFQVPDRAAFILETVELELGLASTNALSDYCCPVFLHADKSQLGHYFATHETGVHSITVPAVDALTKFVHGTEEDDLLEAIVNQPSTADYLLCTKMTSSKNINPIIGFALYYDPISVMALLAQGQLVSLLMVAFSRVDVTDDYELEDIGAFNSPLKKMLSEPFDSKIQRILKDVPYQPIIKVSHIREHSQEECYELLKRTAASFREGHFKQLEKAREEIEKHIKILEMLKKHQNNELERFSKEKQALQEKAETLAEKYEDTKEKQDLLRKRCEKLLLLLAQTKVKPSQAEEKFTKDLRDAQTQIKKFESSIGKLRHQIKYQEVQMDNWKKEQKKFETGLQSSKAQAIKNNLEEMTGSIKELIQKVNTYKTEMGLN